MRREIACDLPAFYDPAAILEPLAGVMDPELDESIVDLGFVRSVRLRSGDAEVTLQLPTSWCAVNFAYLMAEDVRRALLTVKGIHHASIRLGDHCAAPEIEAAVNAGKAFAEAFPAERAGSLAALRLAFLRKGFLVRQERLLRDLRAAGWSPAAICALRIGDLSIENDVTVVRQPGAEPRTGGPAATLRRYLQRRGELDLDCGAGAWLIVDLKGKRVSEHRLDAHYKTARTMRVALEANGLFCRALLSLRQLADATPSGQDQGEGSETCTVRTDTISS